MRSLNISRFSSERDNKPVPEVLTWDQLVAMLAQPKVTTCTTDTCGRNEHTHPRGGCAHKFTGAWSPATYPRGATRDKTNVESISTLVFDVDHATDEQLAAMRLKLAPYRFAEHASHHDRAGDHRRRIVIELSRPVLSAEWLAFWATSASMLGVPADRAAKDTSRLYFLPTRPCDADYFFESHDGVPLDVDEVLTRVAHTTSTASSTPTTNTSTSTTPGGDFYEAVRALDQGAILLTLSGSALVAGQKIELISTGQNGQRRIVIDGRTTGGFIDGQGQIAHSDKGTSSEGPDGGPYVTTWLRHSDYGNTDVNIRHQLAELVPSLAQYRVAKDRRDDQANTASRPAINVPPGGVEELAKAPSPPTPSTASAGAASFLTEDWNVVTSKDPMRLARWFASLVCIDGEGRWTWARWCGAWWCWDRTRYVPVDDEEVRRLLWRWMDLAVTTKFNKRGGKDQESITVNDALVSNVSGALMAAADPIDGAVPKWRDGTAGNLRTLVACQNGILDMGTLTLLPATPNLFVTTAVQTYWDPAAPAPVAWLKFLDEIFAGDAESIATLQMIFAYLISSETGLQKLFALIGPKRSGKSTIERILKALLEAAVTSPTMSGLAERFGLAPLIGKSVAIISDCRLSGRHDHTVAVERLLTITGEGSISIDRKNKDIVDVRLGTRFLLISNVVPGLGDPSGAMASRFIVLSTKRSFFGSEDLGLEARLMAELPGIFRWAVTGWSMLKSAGRFTQPEASLEIVADLEALGSPIAEFVTELCVVAPDATVEVARLYGSYRNWCERTGRLPLDDAGFGVSLRATVPTLSRFRPGSGPNRPRSYRGVRLV